MYNNMCASSITLHANAVCLMLYGWCLKRRSIQGNRTNVVVQNFTHQQMVHYYRIILKIDQYCSIRISTYWKSGVIFNCQLVWKTTCVVDKQSITCRDLSDFRLSKSCTISNHVCISQWKKIYSSDISETSEIFEISALIISEIFEFFMPSNEFTTAPKEVLLEKI